MIVIASLMDLLWIRPTYAMLNEHRSASKQKHHRGIFVKYSALVNRSPNTRPYTPVGLSGKPLHKRNISDTKLVSCDTVARGASNSSIL